MIVYNNVPTLNELMINQLPTVILSTVDGQNEQYEIYDK